MIAFENLTNHPFDSSYVQNVADSLSKKDIELVLCHDPYIQKLNYEYRGKESATDVLSFPLEPMPHSPLGTIVISLDKAKQISKQLGHSVEEEITLLFIHGLLHLLGYDHEVDEGQMRKKEQQLVEQFKLPKSLIVRNINKR